MSLKAALSRIHAYYTVRQHEAERRDFGKVTTSQEDHRAQRTPPSFENLAQDLRYAFRQMRARLGFTAAAIFALALGIGTESGSSIFNALQEQLGLKLESADRRRGGAPVRKLERGIYV